MLPRFSRAVAGVVVAWIATRPVTTRADERAAVASLDEATFLQRVHQRSPRRQALDARQRAARAQVGVAAVLPNPTLSYEREAVPSLDVSDDFVRLGFPLDIAGRRGLAVAAARANAEAERFDVERDAQLLDIEARLAFLETLYAREHLARLDEARAKLWQVVDALRSRATQGDASSYDADRATLELDTLDDERATARRQLETGRLRLGALVGEPATPHDAAGSLVLPAKPDVTAPTPQRPDVDAALARATHADRELRAANRRWIPRFELVAGMMSSQSMGGDGIGYIVGIGGDLPVFDAGGAAADRARADAKRWRAEARANANDARGEVEQARRDLELRIEQAELYLAGPAKRASDLQARAAVAYREGDRPILELLDVQRTARHAAVRALELIYEARRAELVLRRAVGRTR